MNCDRCGRAKDARFRCLENKCPYRIDRVRMEQPELIGFTRAPLYLQRVNIPKSKKRKKLNILNIVKKVAQNPIIKAILLQTRIGRIAYGVVGAITLTTQSQTIMEFTDLSLLQIGITLLAMGATYLIGRLVKNTSLATKIEVAKDVAAEKVIEAVDEKSEGGQKITKNEVKGILSSTLNAFLN